MRRTNHRHQIAAHIARKPRIGDDHTHKVFARNAPLAEQDGRHAQPFLPNFRRPGVIATMRGTADIRVMRAHHRPEHDAPFGKDRHNGGEVRQMRPAMIGVVQQIDIAFLYAIAKGIAHCLHGKGHGADMHRDVIRLRHQPRFGITQRDGEIARRVQDLRIGGAQHRLPHFLHNGAEAVIEDRERDGIRGGFHGVKASS